MFNAHSEPVEFVLPESKWGEQWTIALDTNEVPDHVDVDKVGRQLAAGERLHVQALVAGAAAPARRKRQELSAGVARSESIKLAACAPRCCSLRSPRCSCAAAPAALPAQQPADHRLGGGQPDRRADGDRARPTAATRRLGPLQFRRVERAGAADRQRRAGRRLHQRRRGADGRRRAPPAW